MQEAALDVYSTPEQLGDELITLTLLPRSRWQTLLNLEVISVRLLFSHHSPYTQGLTRGLLTATE